MNGLVTYFYPNPIDGRTFGPLIFYFEKTSVVDGFHFHNELLHIRTSTILNNTVAKSNEQICEEIQKTLENMYKVYKRSNEMNDAVLTDVVMYFENYEENKSLNLGWRMLDGSKKPK